MSVGSGKFDLPSILDVSKSLQNAVLDIFDVFFGTRSSAINDWMTTIVDRVLSVSTRYNIPTMKDDAIKDVKRICALQPSSDEKNELLKVVEGWAQIVASKIATVLIPHLTKMHNASEIAHAQQAIWKACIHYDEVRGHPDGSLIRLSFSQAHLDEACEFLFNQKTRQKPKMLSKVNNDTGGGSQLLWANFFQKSFHEQVCVMLVKMFFVDMLYS